ncbi:nucleoporin NDC1 [Chrysoperla carnea]|uniref:nucleoporin NDC1 n=1 Tax=Chrysoperla carnea TaxID=189513 RepID=UPI001D094862|nr:nucleoporin NDC1 [Chrysoperla carnea]
MRTSDNIIRNNIGVKEILLWRLSTAVVWSVISQIFILTLFLAIVNLNILHPIDGLSIVFNTIFSWRTVFYLVPLAGITFAQGVICSKEYISGNPFLSTRFAIIINLLSIRSIILCGLHTLSGLMTVWLYLTLLQIQNYNSIVKICANGLLKCLNEPNLFLTISGLWIGFYYFIKEHLVSAKNIFFPVIEQNPFLQIKSTMFNLFSTSIFNASLPIGYYLLLFYVYGGYLRNYVLSLSYLEFEDQPLDSIQGLFQPTLILCAWLFASLFVFTMSSMELLFKVNLTRQHNFPITTPSTTVLTLSEAICLGKLPIIQHLACLDLFKLAANDMARRASIFTLSQPGGHPYNWNSIVTASLCLINDYTESLQQVTTEEIIEPNVPKKLDPPQSFTKSYEPLIPSPNSKSINYEPTVYRLRNMGCTKYPEQTQDFGETMEIIQKKYPLTDLLNKIRTKIQGYLNSIPGVNYFFGELRDAKIKYILSQGQPIVWTVQGLSMLASKSYFEDSYGIVHKDLPAIITSLVRLSQCLEKISKTTSIALTRKTSSREQYYGQMQTTLKSAVKRSLYNVCNTFGPFINEFSLPTDVKLQVMTFMVKKDV